VVTALTAIKAFEIRTYANAFAESLDIGDNMGKTEAQFGHRYKQKFKVALRSDASNITDSHIVDLAIIMIQRSLNDGLGMDGGSWIYYTVRDIYLTTMLR